MNDNGAQKKLNWLVHWAPPMVFSFVGSLAGSTLHHAWHGPDLMGGMPVLSVLAASAVTTLVFRKRG